MGGWLHGNGEQPSGSDQDNLHFAGLEHDAESDTEHAQFRNYASAQGRWLAPDPYMGSYDSTNPQSMNRYAYALNNPTSMLDPSGLYTLPTGPCDPNYSDCDPGGPSNPIGCVSWGTQGCIPYPNPGNPGNPGGGSGGGNPGPPFVFKVNATTTQITDLALQVARLEFVPFGVAPNNGSPANPCSGANPNNLNYTAANGQQHIMQNHMAGGKGPGIYAGDWTAIQLLNQATLTMGTQPPSQLLRDARQNTYTLQWTAPPMIWPLSLIFTNNIGWSTPGQPTPTNRLVVTTNCSTVVTSYPIPQ